jgi:hypothetical protein
MRPNQPINSIAVPRPASSWRFVVLVLVLASIAPIGCARLRMPFGAEPAANVPIENPLFIPPMDREFLWNQAVDATDDYFRIEREERVRLIGGVLTEGRIETFPITGSTIFEPWRKDSTPGYEKWHATLQSIRRRALVRVLPTEGGYLLDVTVFKELEDLDRPEHATAGGATLRHDGSLVRQEGAPGRYSVSLGWIPLGRDVTLEQRMLADMRARLGLGEMTPLPMVGGEMGDLPASASPGFVPRSQPPAGPMIEQLPPITGQ